MIFRRSKGRSDDTSLFALTQAYITLDVKLGARFTGNAALCVKEASGIFSSVLDYAKGFLDVSSDISYRVERDRYGYIWFIISTDMIESAVVALDAIADTFIDHGFKGQILASVFAFAEKRGRFYLIYNHRSNRFYPFMPSSAGARDVESEFLIYSLLKHELAFENDKTKWYPIWDIPF